MSVQIKVIAVQGQVLKQTGSSSKQTMVKNGSKLALKGKLILSEDASIIVKLSDGRIVEIHGRDLINQGGEFDLGVLGENTQPLSDLEKLESFATNYKNIVIDESQSNIVRLEDGRVFQKQGKDYVEIAGDSFEDPNAAQGGFRFVQLTRIGDNPVADSVNPVQLHRVDDSIAPLGITYPEPTLTDKPFEHGMGGGAWTPLTPLVVEPVVIAYPTANVSSDTKYEGVDLIHNVHLSTPSTMDTTVTVTLTSNTATIGEDTGRVQYTVDGGKTWVTVNAVELADGSFDITVPAGSQDVQIRVETKQDSILEGEENYSISVSTPYQDTPTTGKGTIIDDARPIDPENVTPPGTVTPPPDAKDPIKPTPDNPAGTPDDDRPTVSVSSDTKYEGVDLIHNVHLSTPSTMDTTVTVTLTSNTATIGEDTGRVQYTVDGGKTWVTVNAVELADGSFDITVPAGSQDVQIRVETKQDSILEGEESYQISVTTPYQDSPAVGKGTILDVEIPIPVVPTISVDLVARNDTIENKEEIPNPATTEIKGVVTHISDGEVIKLTITDTKGHSKEVVVTVKEGQYGTTVDLTGFEGEVTVRATVNSDQTITAQDVEQITPVVVPPIVPPVIPPVIPPVSRPTATITGDTKYEGSDLIHDVTLSNPSDSATTVTVTLTHDTTEAADLTGIQYTTDGGTTWQTATPNGSGSFDVTVPAGGTGFQIRVGTDGDNVLEGRESYDISVKTASQAAADSATGTIVDDGSVIPPTDPVTPPGTVTPPPGTPPYDPTQPNGPVDDDRPTALVNSDSKYEGNTLVHDVALSNASDTATDIVVKLNPTGSNAIEASDISQVFVTVDGGATWTEIPVATALSATGFTVSHPANETAGKVQIRVVSSQDSVLEGPESYEISVQTPKQVADSSSGTGTGTIVDDGSTITPPTPVTPPVTPPTTPPTAPNGNTPNDDRATALVNSDSKYEGNTLVHDVALSNASDTATDIVVKLNPTGSNAIEASDISQVFVTVDGGATWTEIPVATALSATGFTVSHPANETAGKVQIRVVSSQDSVLEGPESYEISVQTPKQVADSSSGTGTGTIVDDGSTITPPTPVTPVVTPPTTPPTAPNGNTPNDDRATALVNSDSKYEGNTLVHDVALSNASDTATDIVVKLNPTGSNAIEASDISQVFVTVDGGATWTEIPVATALSATGFTVSHPANETAGKVQIRVVSSQDSVLEGPESYEISVQTPKQVADSSSGTGTGTIVDDGSTITPPTPVTPVVTPPTTPPTAPNGNTPNDDRATALVNSDSKYEGNTLVHDVALSNASDTATDIVVKLNPTGSNAIEASDISQVFVTVDGGATWTEIPVATALSATGFTVSHPANETAGKVQIRVVSSQDSVLEGPESYEISVQTPKQVADSSSGTGTGTIVDDGSTITPPTPVTPVVTPPTTPPTAPNGNTPNDDRATALVNSDSKYEGNTLVHDVALSNASDTATDIVVKLNPTGSNAIEASDISQVFVTVDGGATWTEIPVATALSATGFTVSHPANETAGKVQIRVVSSQDSVLEGPESYEISVQTPKQVADSSSGTGTGTIVDDGSTITPPTPVTPVVTPPTTPPTAPNGNTPNDDRATALVNSDSKYEGNTLVHDVALSNASDTATHIVVKLDPTGSNAIEASDISQVFVTVDGGATWTEIPVATALSATGFTVSHPANETAGKVQIRVVSSQDSVLEGPESYEISVQTPKQVADSSSGTGTGTIVDDGSTITPPTPVTPVVTPPTTPPTAPNGNTPNDDRATALVNSDSKYEGNTLVHDVALSNASDTATDIVVKLNPTGSNAIEASDISQVFVTVDGGATWTEIPVATALSATGFTVSHPANETAGKVQIRVVSSQDSVLEGPESYEISVQTPKQVADSSSGTGTGTIVDDGSTITPPTPVTPVVTPPTTPPTAPNGNTPNDDRATALVNSDSKYEGNTLVHDVALSNASDTATDIVVKLNPTGSNAIEASDISQVFVTVDGGATWTEIPVATALSATGFTVSHPANETAGKVQIRVVSSQDSVLEGPESYEISVQTPKQVADSSSGTGTGTIVDDGSTITPPTPVTPVVTPPTTPPTAPNGNTPNDDRATALVNSDSKYEGNTLVHDVALSNASDTATDIVVKLNPTGSNAIEASDISQVFVTVDGGATWTEIPVATALSATGFTVSHPANETAGKVQIRVVSSQDSVLEGPESYEISVQTPKQVADSSSGTGTGTIVDDGSTITPPTPVTPVVTPPTTPPTAPNGNTPNDDRATALVNSDSKYEGNTLVHDVALSNASDTATDIVVKLNPTGSNAIEASDISQVFVTVDGGATWTEIPVATALSATGFTVSHPANETAGKVQIRVVSSQDSVLEGPESYEISVQTPKQVADSSSGTGTGTIVDDGSTITPPTPVTPVVTPPTTPPTAPNGNTSNDDRATALVNSDSKYEGNTLVHDVALSNASDTATDIVVKLNPTGSNAIEASDISQVFVTVDGGATWTEIPVATALSATGFTVSHPANETAGKVQIRVVSSQDSVLEGPESYEISVQTPKQVADSSSGTGTGTIVDDGSTITPPTPVTPVVTPPTTPPTAPNGNTPNDDRATALVNSDSKYEGNTLVHDVALSNASDTATDIVVKLNPTGSNAIEASDISQVFVTVDGGATWTEIPVATALSATGFTVSHPANETAGKVQIRVVSSQDSVLEGPESYEISVQTPKQVADSSSGTGTGTIVDDGSTITPPTPVTPVVTPPTTPPTAPNGNTPNDDRATALVNSDSKYEGNTLVHDVALSNASDTATDIVVKLNPTGSNAIEASDISQVFVTVDGGATWTEIPVATALSATGFTVSHPANETAGKVQIRVVSSQDSVLEGPESYEISVQTPKQVADSSSGTGTGTIVDDGSTITPPTPVTPVVTPPTTPPTAPNGNTSNDDRPTASVTSDTKVEGSVLIHDVTLSNTSETNTTVNVKLGATGDTATLSGAGADVDLTPSQINIVIGSTTYTLADLITSGKATGTGSDFTLTLTPTEQAGGFQVRISSIDDTAVESDESYTISVATPKQVAGDAPVATNTGTITDNDVAAVLNITEPATINEAAGTATYTVTLSASSTSTVTVNFATANGTATSGTDYTSTSGTLTFAPGVTTQTITVPILNDHTIESNENYTISLNTPTNATIGTGSATTTIIDDDVAPMIDLDDDNSSGETGADYRTNYTVGAAAGISIGDTDLKVTDSNVPSGAPNTAHIKSATITLTNAQAGDVFTAGALPSDITASKVGNTITLTSASGSTLANFEAAIKAVTFKASDTTPHPEVDRIVKVKVTDIGGNESNEATSTISVNVIQAPGQPGGPTNGNDTITGGNGDDIIVSDVGGLGVPDQISAKYNLAFIVDVSGSMAWSMDSLSSGALNNGNSRLDILKDALREYIGGYFMDALDGTPGGGLINQNVELNIGLIPFGSTAGTRQTMRISLSGGDTWDDVNNKINALATTGSTNYEAGFNSAITWFQGLNSAYTDATGKAVNGYVNMTYFLTDGDPNLVGSGTSASVANALTAARTSFETLVSTTGINSSVSAIGMGAAANKSYLSLFDNTVKGVTDGFNGLTGLASHTVDAGTGEGWRSNSINSTPIANFETATGLNAVSAWTASGDAVAPAIVNTTVKNYVGTSSPDAAANTAVASNRLELDDATQNNGQAAIYTSASFTVTQNNAYAVFDYSHTGFNRGPATVVNTEQGTSSPASNVNYYYNSDLFTWTLQKEVSSGVWINVDTGTNAASIRGGTSNVPMSSQFLENGKTYRYVFTVEDKTTGSENYQVRIDNIRLHYPDSGSDTISKNVGEARTVMTGPELVEVLKSGSVKPNPNGGGNDTVHGGAGHDIIFGDSINTDWLSWAGRDIYDVNAPNGLGSGIAALDKYLQSHGFATGSGGTVESIDRYNFIKANHAAFSGDSINVGGNDILYGDAGNDILYGQGGIDTLYGGDGNDILYGGKGNDVLWGNAGADIFAWAAKDIGTTALPDTDTIKDFNKDDGDILDAKALLNALGWTGSGNLSDFVTVTNGSNSINIHDATHTNIVTIVVESTEFTNFSSIADMITKTNFQS